MKILAIESDEFMKIFLKDVFWIHSEKKSELLVAGNVKEAQDILSAGKFTPDLIFLDLKLSKDKGEAPDIQSGLQFLKNLRADPKNKKIKVLIFSSFGDKELEDEALKLGADRFLVKGEYLPQEINRIAEATVSG